MYKGLSQSHELCLLNPRDSRSEKGALTIIPVTPTVNRFTV